jgi:hypothetical protein
MAWISLEFQPEDRDALLTLLEQIEVAAGFTFVFRKDGQVQLFIIEDRTDPDSIVRKHLIYLDYDIQANPSGGDQQCRMQ